jgi:hypothetical protein
MKEEQGLQQYDNIETKLESDDYSILRIIRRHHASFPSEIVSETGMSEYNLKQHLYVLREKELVEHIFPDFHNPQQELLIRVPDMSNRGQGGFPAFCQKRWFKLTEKGHKIACKVEM